LVFEWGFDLTLVFGTGNKNTFKKDSKMHYKKSLTIALIVLCLCYVRVAAQETIPASGGEATGSGGSVSYSLGQIVYSVNTGANGTAVQSVQQPFEISVVSGINEQPGISLSLSAYPNPASDYLTLRIENFDNENLTYSLLDINGKLLENKIITGNETEIDMSRLIPSTYFLKIIVQTMHASSQNAAHQEIKSFKIIKK
jgi:hypothetical protein